MGNAKVIIKQQDRPSIVPSLSGVDIGTVVNSKWGPTEPILTTNPTQLINYFSKPDNKKGSSWNGAELLLASSNKVWITRAIHDDARYSASLVKFKISPTNFNNYPLPGAIPESVVQPLVGGISLTGLNNYSFPLYATDRTYEAIGIRPAFSNTQTSRVVEFSTLETTPGHVLTAGDRLSIAVGATNNSLAVYDVLSAAETTVSEHTLIVSDPVTAVAGTEILDNANASFNPVVRLVRDAVATTTLIVNDHDDILNGEILKVGATTVTADTKELVSRLASLVTFEVDVPVTTATIFHRMTSDEIEDRDSFLVVAKYAGDLGNKIKVGTRKSNNYPTAFWVDVYFDKVLVESYECTKESFIDGFGTQMQLETKINGISSYITVKDNIAADQNTYPLFTTTGVWRKNSVDLFTVSALITSEDIVKDDDVLALTSVAGLTINSRFKLGSSTSDEYKVLAINGLELSLDRPFIATRVPAGTSIYLFSPTINDTINGIYNGTQHFKFTRIDADPTLSIGDQLTISSNTGVVLDAGMNNLKDGFDGSALTVYDIITAFNKMNNKEKYKISIFCDNGFTYPEVAIALDEIAKLTNLSHSYLSTTLQSELNANRVAAIKSYRNSTNLNTEFSSMFSGWIEVTDIYNQTKVWVAPSVFGVNSQSFVTRRYYAFTPAAGWVYGRLNGLNISAKFTEGERDELVDAQINPIRYREGFGLAVWGNETLYTRPSPLQLRSVAMLLIILKYGLENYLEYKLFAMNREPTWTEIESAVSIFIRDELYTPGGLYAYQVAVKSIITDTDIDARRCPIFVGIQPTMDIKEIPVTLGIFNKSVTITR